MAAPSLVRGRGGDHVGKRLRGIFAALIANGFPLSRENVIHASLEHLGRLMYEGWSVVIFATRRTAPNSTRRPPEGEQRIGGPLLPFQSGTACWRSNLTPRLLPVRPVSEGARAPLLDPGCRCASGRRSTFRQAPPTSTRRSRSRPQKRGCSQHPKAGYAWSEIPNTGDWYGRFACGSVPRRDR